MSKEYGVGLKIAPRLQLMNDRSPFADDGRGASDLEDVHADYLLAS